ncbi:MAG: phenylalanine--tRNA ligase subunit alpha [Proteobacteria bacterium]|nr:MAG: phenylalanine--tRNA ligase subunit alpha [Pseudomonadota bacterium]
MDKLESLASESVEAVNQAGDADALERLRVRYLGKKGLVTGQLKLISTLPPQDRRAFGQSVNSLKQELTQLIRARGEDLAAQAIEQRLQQESIDVTLPGRRRHCGSFHPVTRTIRRMEEIFASLGFDSAQGPEIEEDFFNFEALNIPADHPARAMHDTFYVDDSVVLRTHTSPVQIRYMMDHTPPLQVIAPGRVYRCDSDVTHTPMFHQVEGLAVGEGINFGHLKGVLTHFLKAFFESDLKVKFRPSYFPFTEPSAEVDISCVFCGGPGCRVCKQTGWIEILGCGMVHPEVFRHVNVDSEKFTGYAFGVGVERMTMLRYGVDDLRLFFENDVNFLAQFQ